MPGPDLRLRAFLGLGSNLGDRLRNLERAVSSIPDLVAVSPVYETEPVGGPIDQGQYLNLVVEMFTALSSIQLLELCWKLETEAGRVREVRWGPRTLDADVLLVGDLQIDQADLQVPHPRIWERRFVLQPLADLAPELVDDEHLELAWGSVQMIGRLRGH